VNVSFRATVAMFGNGTLASFRRLARMTGFHPLLKFKLTRYAAGPSWRSRSSAHWRMKAAAILSTARALGAGDVLRDQRSGDGHRRMPFIPIDARACRWTAFHSLDRAALGSQSPGVMATPGIAKQIDDRIAPVAAKIFPCHLDARRGLAPLIFGDIKKPFDFFHGFEIVA
jgi:hypothetical protein